MKIRLKPLSFYYRWHAQPPAIHLNFYLWNVARFRRQLHVSPHDHQSRELTEYLLCFFSYCIFPM